jgi:hypothetical protein
MVERTRVTLQFGVSIGETQHILSAPIQPTTAAVRAVLQAHLEHALGRQQSVDPRSSAM